MSLQTPHRPLSGPLTRLVPRMVGLVLIAVSAAYFVVQAQAAWERADDAQSFALLLAQNICRVSSSVDEKPAQQMIAAQSLAQPQRAELRLQSQEMGNTIRKN